MEETEAGVMVEMSTGAESEVVDGGGSDVCGIIRGSVAGWREFDGAQTFTGRRDASAGRD